MVDAIIRLFESTAQDFSSNGIGYLVDAISCKVTEERNGAFELEMKYPVTGRKYSEIALRRLIISKSNPYSTPQAFRIYEITKPINGVVSIYAEHISYDMSGYAVAPIKKQENINNALRLILNNCITECPFRFWTDKATESDFESIKPSSMRNLLGGQEGSILDVYHAEFEFDNFLVKVHNHRGANNGVTIRYGKNLTDLEQEENCANVYTGVYPYWYSEEDGLVQCNPKIILTPGSYNFQRVLTLDLSTEWVEKPTEAQLKSRAESYISSNDVGVPKVSLTISFIDLADAKEYEMLAKLEQVKLCDTVTVLFPALGVEATSKCIKTIYNVLTDKYESLELGEAKSNLATSLVNSSFDVQNKIIETEDRLRTVIVKGDGLLRVQIDNETKKLQSSITITADAIRNEVADDFKGVQSQLKQTADTIVMKVDNNGKLVRVALGADPSTGSQFDVTADNINLSANDIFKIMSKGTLDLTSQKIKITSDNFEVDEYGNVKCTSLEAIELKGKGIEDFNNSIMESEIMKRVRALLDQIDGRMGDVEALLGNAKILFDLLDDRLYYWTYSGQVPFKATMTADGGLQNYVTSIDTTGYRWLVARCLGTINGDLGGATVDIARIGLTFSNDPNNNNPDTPVVNIVTKGRDDSGTGKGLQGCGPNGEGLFTYASDTGWYNAYIDISALTGVHKLNCFLYGAFISGDNAGGFMWCSKISLTNIDPA